VAYAADLTGQELKAVAIDVGCGKNDLTDARHFGTVAIEIAQDLQQELVAHAVGDNADVLRAGFFQHHQQELLEIRLCLLRALAIVGIARDARA
jgi:hypothetical protein